MFRIFLRERLVEIKVLRETSYWIDYTGIFLGAPVNEIGNVTREREIKLSGM